MATVYLIGHSELFKVHRGNTNTQESILIENEKSQLSIKREKMAGELASYDEFDDNYDLVNIKNLGGI